MAECGNELCIYGLDEKTDSGDTNPFRYCSEYYDAETGNIYLRARYYDLSTCSFIPEDPAWAEVNWYGYCGGNADKCVNSSRLCYYVKNVD